MGWYPGKGTESGPQPGSPALPAGGAVSSGTRAATAASRQGCARTGVGGVFVPAAGHHFGRLVRTAGRARHCFVFLENHFFKFLAAFFATVFKNRHVNSLVRRLHHKISPCCSASSAERRGFQRHGCLVYQVTENLKNFLANGIYEQYQIDSLQKVHSSGCLVRASYP